MITNVKQVKRFETSDGRTHDSELTAIVAQREIDIRAILQQDGNIGSRVTISSGDAVKAVVSNAEAISATMAAYKVKINRLRKRTGPAVS